MEDLGWIIFALVMFFFMYYGMATHPIFKKKDNENN